MPTITLCPDCIDLIGGACAGPDVPWRRAAPHEPCEAADCVRREARLVVANVEIAEELCPVCLSRPGARPLTCGTCSP